MVLVVTSILPFRAILEAMPQLDLSLSPQNDARRATILALPPQIEADILPADVADTIWSLWLDAYNGKPPLEFFFSLKCHCKTHGA